MTTEASMPATTVAVVEVRRPRRVSELMAIGWRVFIDGVWVGAVTQGRSVRFAVPPGVHGLRIWSHRGAYCSDEVAFHAAPGSICAFECRSRPMTLGLSRMRDQVKVITSTMTDGGVTNGQILLSEIQVPGAR
jgi:hypothetical protein